MILNLSSNITSIPGGQSSYCLLVSMSTQCNNIGSYELYRQSLAGMLYVLKCLHSLAFNMKRICHIELISQDVYSSGFIAFLTYKRS